MRERRRFNRVHEPLELFYRGSGQLASSWHKATLVNISAGGLRLRTDESIETGALLELQMKMPGNREQMEIKGLAVWVDMPGAGIIECGIEFSDTNPEKLMQIDAIVEFLRTTGGTSA